MNAMDAMDARKNAMNAMDAQRTPITLWTRERTRKERYGRAACALSAMASIRVHARSCAFTSTLISTYTSMSGWCSFALCSRYFKSGIPSIALTTRDQKRPTPQIFRPHLTATRTHDAFSFHLLASFLFTMTHRECRSS
eukprot:scaffold844_cov142-Skeletonema_menzelii.AAC.9